MAQGAGTHAGGEEDQPGQEEASSGQPKGSPHLQAQDLMEILNRAFRVYFNNLGVIVRATGVIYIPMFALVLLGLFLVLIAPSPEASGIIFLVVALVKVPFAIAAWILTEAIVSKMVSDHYVGKKPDVWEAFGFCWRRIGAIVSAMLVKIILIVLGTAVGGILLLIPGLVFLLYTSITWVFVSVVATIEGTAAYDACKRSKNLVGDTFEDYARVFAYLVLVFVIMFVIALILMPIQFCVGLIAGLLELQVAGQLVAELLGIFINVVVQPLPVVALVLLYYDQRIRREGFDLEVLAQHIKG